ncbi:ASF1 anti-silencing function 1 [Dinochytrium kinnereticum]|nr:ASF1 anti-silencing function 1 [Dinochytrium kinnereticum]
MLVSLTNVTVLDNPTAFLNPFKFEITFDVITELKEDLEFKLVYVGSAENEKYDQVLESVMVGPVPVGVSKFVFEADPPNVDLLPPNDIIEVTAVLLSCSYKEKEFIRVGYLVNVDYADEEMRETPPEKINVEKLERNILTDKPRVTRFSIPWDDEEVVQPAGGGEEEEEEEDGGNGKEKLEKEKEE